MSVQANMNDNPAAAERNRHHTWNTSNTWSVQTQQELEDELFGRGAGDPDILIQNDTTTDNKED